jgi:hypothetical protein
VSQLRDVRTRLRATDDRVPLVERRLLGARLGLTGDDLDLLLNTTVTDLLELPASVTLTIGASRLLAELDAHVARAHPVDLSSHGPLTTAEVPLGEDDALQLVLEDGLIYLPPALDREGQHALDPDDAEALAYALIRLAGVSRADAERDADRAELAHRFATQDETRAHVVDELAEELP